MAYKLVKTSESAAYRVAIGATAEDAARDGLGVVELNHSTVPPAPIYGIYDDAPKDGPIPITVAKAADTEVIGGGTVGEPGMPSALGGKGSLANLNDPVVRPVGDESIHADGSAPPQVDPAAEETALRDAAADEGELAGQVKSKKK